MKDEQLPKYSTIIHSPLRKRVILSVYFYLLLKEESDHEKEMNTFASVNRYFVFELRKKSVKEAVHSEILHVQDGINYEKVQSGFVL